jgi:hypothetical protein
VPVPVTLDVAEVPPLPPEPPPVVSPLHARRKEPIKPRTKREKVRMPETIHARFEGTTSNRERTRLDTLWSSSVRSAHHGSVGKQRGRDEVRQR